MQYYNSTDNIRATQLENLRALAIYLLLI